MLRSRNLIVILTVAVACMWLAAPISADDGGCKSKAKTTSTCGKTTSSDSKAKAGCSKPCTKPCTGAAAGHLGAKESGDVQRMTFGVAYLSCQGCANTVTAAIKEVKGIKSVSVDHRSGIADVEYDNGMVISSDVIKAVEKAGYHAQVGPYSASEIEEFAKAKTGSI